MAYLLEVVAYDIDSCQLIELAGAGRIELCANPLEGGTTPSPGMIRIARKQVSLPIHSIIRPRGGDFVYSEAELRVMLADIQFCKENGMDGVVLGLLNKEGNVNLPWLSRLVELSYPLEVTFHKAFDRTRYPLQALEDIIQSGCTRILSSGAAPTALEGVDLINTYIAAARNRIGILPGGGIRSGNIAALASTTGAQEFHSSAKRLRRDAIAGLQGSSSESTGTYSVDPAELSDCLERLRLMENECKKGSSE